MLHHINELYEIKGQRGIYEFEAIKNLSWTEVRRAGAMPRGKEMKVYQADGSYKIAYLYGEKTWSYNKTEIDNHQKASQEQREKARARKILTDKVLAVCAEMSIEELEKFIEKIEKRA